MITSICFSLFWKECLPCLALNISVSGTLLLHLMAIQIKSTWKWIALLWKEISRHTHSNQTVLLSNYFNPFKCHGLIRTYFQNRNTSRWCSLADNQYFHVYVYNPHTQARPLYKMSLTYSISAHTHTEINCQKRTGSGNWHFSKVTEIYRWHVMNVFKAKI